MTIADINTEIRDLCDADSTSLTAATLLYRVNEVYKQIVGKLIAIDRRWKFGDENYTSQPTFTQDLTNGQRQYDFPSSTFLNAYTVEVLDNHSNWHTLNRIDLEDVIRQNAQLEYQETSGRPNEYEMRDNFIYLYPPPDNGVNVTLTAGLRVIGQRGADVFTSAQVTTGTKEPGFAAPYHMLLVYRASLPHLLKYQPERLNAVYAEINRLDKDMIEFYSQKGRDASNSFLPRFKSHR